MFLPPGSRHFCSGCVVKMFPVIVGNSVVSEPEEPLAHFEQPAVLGCVFDGGEPWHEATDFFFRVESLLFDLLTRESGRVGQFGIVVVTENISESSGGCLVRIDVGMGVDQPKGFELGEDVCQGGRHS